MWVTCCISQVSSPHTLGGTSMHSLQSDGVLAGSWFAVSHQEAGFPAELQLSLSLLSTHTAMVPACRGDGEREGEHAERDSRSLTYSIVTYGDESDVTLMIGVDGERQKKEHEADEKWRAEIPTRIYIPSKSHRCTVDWGLNNSHWLISNENPS